MNTFSRQTVVDRLAAELAERRRTAGPRRAAYLALAQAILSDDLDELRRSAALERQPSKGVHATAAA